MKSIEKYSGSRLMMPDSFEMKPAGIGNTLKIEYPRDVELENG